MGGPLAPTLTRPLLVFLVLDLSLPRSQVLRAMELEGKDTAGVSRDKFVGVFCELARRAKLQEKLSWDLKMVSRNGQVVTPNDVRFLCKLYRGTRFSDQEVDVFLKTRSAADSDLVSVEELTNLLIEDPSTTAVLAPAQLDS